MRLFTTRSPRFRGLQEEVRSGEVRLAVHVVNRPYLLHHPVFIPRDRIRGCQLCAGQLDAGAVDIRLQPVRFRREGE